MADFHFEINSMTVFEQFCNFIIDTILERRIKKEIEKLRKATEKLNNSVQRG